MVVSEVKIAPLIEPFNESGTYDYTAIYDHFFTLYETYAGSWFIDTRYSPPRPVLFWYNGEVMTGTDPNCVLPLDDRFSVIIVGHRSYCDWWYDDIRQYVPTRFPWNDHVSVFYRFDDYQQVRLGLRPSGSTINQNLGADFIKEQWDRAIKYANRGEVRYITVGTFNEYPERTFWEPAYDYTAKTDPYYLLNETRRYVSMLRGEAPVVAGVWYQNPLVFGIVVIGVALGVALLWKH